MLVASCLDDIIDVMPGSVFVVVISEMRDGMFGGDTRVVTNMDMVSAGVLLQAAAERIDE